MVVLLGVAVLISSLMARIQINLAKTKTREQEAIQLYELSMALSGKNDALSISRTLAQGLMELLKPDRVEIEVNQSDPQVMVGIPDDETLEPPSFLCRHPADTWGRFGFGTGDDQPDPLRPA